ncbi:MAG: hypothetical protein KDE48_24525 [Anaerolineales bacterium]|nr:hypothetical protein [Anaerolineales bacterium]
MSIIFGAAFIFMPESAELAIDEPAASPDNLLDNSSMSDEISVVPVIDCEFS